MAKKFKGRRFILVITGQRKVKSATVVCVHSDRWLPEASSNARVVDVYPNYENKQKSSDSREYNIGSWCSQISW